MGDMPNQVNSVIRVREHSLLNQNNKKIFFLAFILHEIIKEVLDMSN